MHRIDEVPEESTLKANKLNQSLTDIIQSTEEPLFSGIKNKSAPTANTSSDSNEDEDEDEDEMLTLSIALADALGKSDEHHIKHSESVPVMHMDKSKPSLNDTENDDDEIWCNPEDENNLEYRVKLDEEKENYLREVLGNETLEIVREALKV